MTPTPIQLAKELFAIHQHLIVDGAESNPVIAYTENDLLPLLKSWGFPDPDWDGNAQEQNDFIELLKKVYCIKCPGEKIKEYMEAAGMTTAELADKLGVPVDYAEDLLIGNLRAPGFAERLEEIFGVDRQVWIKSQNDYDRALANASMQHKKDNL